MFCKFYFHDIKNIYIYWGSKHFQIETFSCKSENTKHPIKNSLKQNVDSYVILPKANMFLSL